MSALKNPVEGRTSAAPEPLPVSPPVPQARESAAPEHALQRTLGNRALSDLLRTGLIHPKLAFGAADDPEEREADHAAVVALASPEPSAQQGSCPSCAAAATPCAACRKSPSVETRSPRLPQPVSGSPEATGASGAGHPLPASTRAFFEPRFGLDLDAVRVHDDSAAAADARSLGARAFTLGTDIRFAAGEYRPDSQDGRALLAHELAHVALQHRGIHRREDMDLAAQEEWAEKRRIEAEERERLHQAWTRGVQGQFSRDLSGQSRTLAEERERLELALTTQRAAAFDAVLAGQGWLAPALREQGYSGPGLTEVKQAWGEAMVAAELLRPGASVELVSTDFRPAAVQEFQERVARGTVSTESRLAALQTIPAFYDALASLAAAVEQAHQQRVDAENNRLEAEYKARLAEFERRRDLEQSILGPIDRTTTLAILGGVTGLLAPAIAYALPPLPPTYRRPPPRVSSEVPGARTRVYAAQSNPEWAAVGRDVQRLGTGLATLLLETLPSESEVRTGAAYLEKLDARLAGIEAAHPLAVRIPAVFYPKDRTISRTEEGGGLQVAPEAIPWQFYLINTGVRSHDEPAHSGGEWVLIDVTSDKRFENREPASDADSVRLQQGDTVDPPISLFSELNSRIRFPEGRLYFTLPKGTSYYLETTEPWSLSDWLSAIGMALAAIALVAAVIATGGAAAPAAVAFYAGVGAAAFGVGSTLASLHEKSQHGILTSKDVDEAMISIAIDIVTAASMGLGRLVALPRAAARIGLTGERFLALQRVTQAVRTAVVAGDVYQAWTFTSGLIAAFKAIDNEPGLSDEERSRRRAQLVRRALITGALLAVAIRGDVADATAGRTLRVSHVDPDGTLVVPRSSETLPHGATDAPHPHPDAPGSGGAAHVAPHAEVTGPVHTEAGRAGSSVTVGPQSHALSVAGTGPRRDFYFCSDLCAPIALRLSAIIEVLPRGHPERAIFQDLLSRARGASQRLKLGRLTQEEADGIARKLSEDIGRHSQQSELFAALMNTDPRLLAEHGGAIRQRLARDADIQRTHLTSQGETQAANRGSGRGRDPLSEPETRSPIETDILGGLDIQVVGRPSRGPQPIHFDVGNFSHTNAEALVPGLPRGLNKEVPVTLPDGTAGRADRVRFIYDGDGDRIGAHVFEVKPDTPDNIARGETQAQQYVAGLQAEIERDLRAAGKAVPTTAPDGGPLYLGRVVTYNYEQMIAVLRALRASRRDAARLAEFEAVARQVFGAATP